MSLGPAKVNQVLANSKICKITTTMNWKQFYLKRVIRLEQPYSVYLVQMFVGLIWILVFIIMVLTEGSVFQCLGREEKMFELFSQEQSRA